MVADDRHRRLRIGPRWVWRKTEVAYFKTVGETNAMIATRVGVVLVFVAWRKLVRHTIAPDDSSSVNVSYALFSGS